MTNEDLKALYRQFNVEVMENQNIDAIDELLAEDFVEHQAMPGMSPGLEGVKEMMGMMFGAFSDIKWESKIEVAEGDLVAAFGTLSFTHTGDFMGMPATGKRASIDAADFVKFRDDGKATDHWGIMDMGALMEQLGASPPSA